MPYPGLVRLVVARCSVDYTGRLTAHLPLAPRLLIIKADGSVLIHSDGGSYKPLNWMSPPCTLSTTRRSDDEAAADPEGDWIEQWDVVHDKSGDRLRVRLHEVFEDSSHELGVDPGLQKDGVEAHLQALLADNIETLGDGWSLVGQLHRHRAGGHPGPGPRGRLGRDRDQAPRGDRRRRAADPLSRAPQPDPLLAPVRGIFAAQAIKPQARVLANDRGIDCVTLDYDALRGIDDAESRLF